MEWSGVTGSTGPCFSLQSWSYTTTTDIYVFKAWFDGKVWTWQPKYWGKHSSWITPEVSNGPSAPCVYVDYWETQHELAAWGSASTWVSNTLVLLCFSSATRASATLDAILQQHVQHQGYSLSLHGCILLVSSAPFSVQVIQVAPCQVYMSMPLNSI